jgi:hypothetical protein
MPGEDVVEMSRAMGIPDPDGATAIATGESEGCCMATATDPADGGAVDCFASSALKRPSSGVDALRRARASWI